MPTGRAGYGCLDMAGRGSFAQQYAMSQHDRRKSQNVGESPYHHSHGLMMVKEQYGAGG